MKIVQISDTHLTARGGRTQQNLDRIIDYVNNTARPDLIVHSGDIVIIHPDDADDRTHAHTLMQKFTAPVLVVPGNHDIGEPGAAPWKGIGVTDDRIAAFEKVWALTTGATTPTASPSSASTANCSAPASAGKPRSGPGSKTPSPISPTRSG